MGGPRKGTRVSVHDDDDDDDEEGDDDDEDDDGEEGEEEEEEEDNEGGAEQMVFAWSKEKFVNKSKGASARTAPADDYAPQAQAHGDSRAIAYLMNGSDTSIPITRV